jgi:phosphate transport system substrate-binding protein
MRATSRFFRFSVTVSPQGARIPFTVKELQWFSSANHQQEHQGMKIFQIFALCGLLALAAGSVQAADKVVIAINGSTTVLPIMQSVSESYMAANPNIQIELSGGGSGNGIKALIEGQTMIAMSSRDIKSSETDQAKAKGVTPNRIAVAVDALVPVVHPSSKVAALSLEQLKALYEGKVSNWKEVGGDDAKVVLISRDTSSGTYETWAEMVMKGEKVTPSALMQASNGAVVQAVSKNKNAIGYIGIGYLNKSVKGLRIGETSATAETALSRAWPLSRELYVFTNGQPQSPIREFIAYLLDPAKGQKAVQDSGFVPLPR